MRVTVVLVVLSLAGTSCRAPAARRTPAALYNALLSTKIPAPSVPPGFHLPRVVPSNVGDEARDHGAVGAAEVIVNANDAAAAVRYVVFPSRAAALADHWSSPATVGRIVRRSEAPKALPTPSAVVVRYHTGEGPFGKRTTTMITTVEFVDGFVAVTADVIGLASPDIKKDFRRTLRLAQFALEHLRATSKS